MQTIAAFVADVDLGDMKSAEATFARPATIVDEFPPYRWSGARAFAQWVHDFGTFAHAEQLTKTHIEIEPSRATSIAGSHAYAPIPTIVTAKKNGRTIVEHGTLTFALDERAGEWRIASMTWTAKP